MENIKPLEGIKRLAGRDKYINTLKLILKEVEDGRGHCVLIEGEIGVGKTTLVRKFAEDTDAKFIRVQGLTYRSFEPYLPFLEVLGTEEIEKSLPSLLLPDSGHHDDLIKIRRDAIPEKIRQKIISLSSDKPLILFLDDMQWMDEGSLTVFLYILRSLHKSKILLIGAYRPEDLITDTGIHPLKEILNRLKGENITKISLPNLSFEDFRYLMLDILGYKISLDILKIMYRHTNGNPYLINEYLSEVISRGLLDMDKKVLKPGVSIEDISIPQNVKSILLRKSNMISDDAKKILRIASVLGNEFNFEEIVEISEMDEEKVLEALEELINMDFIEEAGERYRFKYYQVGRAVYENLSKIHRRILHKKVAEYFEKKTDDPFILGKHYYLAGNKEKGEKYLLMAARESQRRGAYRTSLWYLNSLISMGVEDPEIYYMLLNAELVAGEGKRMEEYFKKIDEKSDYYAPATLLLSTYLEESGRFKDALEILKNAATKTSGNNKALILSKIAFITTKYEDPDKALKILQEAFKYAESDFAKGVLWKTQGIAYYYKNDGENALKSFHKAEEIISNWNSLHPEMVRILNDLGLTYLGMGKFNEAKRYFWECRKIAEKLGFLRMIPTVINNTSWIYLYQGSVYESEKLFKEAMERAMIIDDLELVARTHTNLAYVYMVMGEYEKSLEYARKVFEILPEHKELVRRAKFRIALIKIFKGNEDAGEREIRELANSESNDPFIYTYISDLLYYTGRYRELVEYLDTILPQMNSGKEDVLLFMAPVYLYLGMEDRFVESMEFVKDKFIEGTIDTKEIELFQYVRDGKLEDALKIVKEFWDLGYRNPTIYTLIPLGGYMLKKGNKVLVEKAEELAKKINDLNAVKVLKNLDIVPANE